MRKQLTDILDKLPETNVDRDFITDMGMTVIVLCLVAAVVFLKISKAT